MSLENELSVLLESSSNWSSGRHLANLVEGGAVFAEITPYVLSVKYEYGKVLKKINGDRELFEDPDKALFLNLGALCWGLETSLSEMHEKGIFVPATLYYRSVADYWDDEFDGLVAKGEKPDPERVFLDGMGQKTFKAASESIFGASREFWHRRFASSTELYIKSEARLSDCSWTEGKSRKEILKTICDIRACSFGQYAAVLTEFAAFGLGRSFEKTEMAKKRLFYFAILGGFLDGTQDVAEDKNLVTCLGNFKKIEILKVASALISKVLE